MKLLKLALFALALAAPATRAQVVINEVASLIDWVEVANFGAGPVDISGWHLYSWYQPSTTNPIAYTFPGAAGSGTTMLAPNAAIVVSDVASFPTVPVGAVRLYTGFAWPWSTAAATSMILTDPVGNGIDYYAFGNPNGFQAPFELGTLLGNPPGTPTNWTGPAMPAYGGIGFINTSDAHYRHTRTDTDAAADWTNTGAASGATLLTPGALNAHQYPAATATGTPTAQFTASIAGGFGPLDVNFTQTTLGQAELTTVLWDFDFALNPGVSTSTDFHPRFTFNPASTRTYTVRLSVIDALGGTSFATTTITVNVIAPPTPVAAVPYVERFEGAVSSNLTRADPVNGWEINTISAGSRVRTVDPRTLPGVAAGYADAGGTSLPIAAILDSSTGTSTTELVLHVDLVALGGGFRLRYNLYSNLDEVTATDVVCVQDGVTLGNGVLSNGQSTGSPGRDGFAEALLNDWNTTLAPGRVWRQFDVLIDAAYLAANGLSPSADMRIIFRQVDDSTFELADGLLIDEVEVLPIPPAGPGQPCSPGIASFDINSAAVNANGNPVNFPVDLSGPHAVTITSGQLEFTFDGEPNQPVVLISGPLNPGVATISFLGRCDVGLPNLLPPFIPNGIIVVMDGTVPTLPNVFFNTGPAGTSTISFGLPLFPPNTVIPFQCVMYSSTVIARFSNTVLMTIP